MLSIDIIDNKEKEIFNGVIFIKNFNKNNHKNIDFFPLITTPNKNFHEIIIMFLNYFTDVMNELKTSLKYKYDWIRKENIISIFADKKINRDENYLGFYFCLQTFIVNCILIYISQLERATTSISIKSLFSCFENIFLKKYKENSNLTKAVMFDFFCKLEKYSFEKLIDNIKKYNKNLIQKLDGQEIFNELDEIFKEIFYFIMLKSGVQKNKQKNTKRRLDTDENISQGNYKIQNINPENKDEINSDFFENGYQNNQYQNNEYQDNQDQYQNNEYQNNILSQTNQDQYQNNQYQDNQDQYQNNEYQNNEYQDNILSQTNQDQYQNNQYQNNQDQYQNNQYQNNILSQTNQDQNNLIQGIKDQYQNNNLIQDQYQNNNLIQDQYQNNILSQTNQVETNQVESNEQNFFPSFENQQSNNYYFTSLSEPDLFDSDKLKLF